MKSSLIDTIFLSEKRINLLLLLLDGPKSSDDIKDMLDVNWGAMIPQIKKLQEWELIDVEDRVYSLSDMGRPIVENVLNLLNILEIYEKNFDYLSTRRLSVIPPDLLKSMSEMETTSMIETDLTKIFDANEEVIENMKDAKKCISLISFFQPQYNELYNTLIKNGCDVTFVFSESVWNKIKSVYVYEKGVPSDGSIFLDWMNTRIYIVPDGIDILELTLTDEILLLSFFDDESRFDSRYLLCKGKNSLKWGKKLYDSLTKDIKRIETNIKN